MGKPSAVVMVLATEREYGEGHECGTSSNDMSDKYVFCMIL